MAETVEIRRVRMLFPPAVLEGLARIHHRRQSSLYLTGGSVRDLLLQRTAVDLDLTVGRDAAAWAADLQQEAGGTLVPLGRDEDAARLVHRGLDIDFSSFREGARTIEQELKKRDITINSMALCLDNLFGTGEEDLPLIDPVGGAADLADGLIRMTSRHAFRSDPLRMVRVYRFAACFSWTVEEKTAAMVSSRADLLARSAPERISHELDLIMRSQRAHAAFAAMAGTGLLWSIIPELRAGVGMAQPASHHLDVFAHSLAALDNMERIIAGPESYFGEHGKLIGTWLEKGRRRVRLKWAALLHDLGKPVTYGINEDKGNRITFYNHDREGARLFEEIARRLKMSGDDRRAVAALIAHHMWPFHLNNVRRQGKLSLKARIKIARTIGDELPGLFLLSMADALAGLGEARPEAVEEEIVSLFREVEEVRASHVEPALQAPPLVSGRDLIDIFGLTPGPHFRRLLQSVEEARLEKKITTRQQALHLLEKLLKQKNDGGPSRS